jgi:hypothetical protein
VNDKLRTRFDAKVDRSPDHHRWTCSRTTDGAWKPKVDGRTVSARRIAWDLERGPLAPAPCSMRAARTHHACGSRTFHSVASRRSRPAAAGATRHGVKGRGPSGGLELTVTAGRYANGRVRRVHRTVRADTEAEATRALAAFVAEVRHVPLPEHRHDRDVTVDEALEQFLTEHLLGEKDREPRTMEDYRRLHLRWFAPEVGRRWVRDCATAMPPDYLTRRFALLKEHVGIADKRPAVRPLPRRRNVLRRDRQALRAQRTLGDPRCRLTGVGKPRLPARPIAQPSTARSSRSASSPPASSSTPDSTSGWCFWTTGTSGTMHRKPATRRRRSTPGRAARAARVCILATLGTGMSASNTSSASTARQQGRLTRPRAAPRTRSTAAHTRHQQVGHLVVEHVPLDQIAQPTERNSGSPAVSTPNR